MYDSQRDFLLPTSQTLTFRSEMANHFERAAEAIQNANAVLIGAGAGMGVDSGLPDFRGDHGFWKAYPAFRGRSFSEMSNPIWFHSDPHQAWGFFGHRLKLYRRTVPHPGFEILRRWGEMKPHGYFVFTSNVDGQFQRSEYSDDRILECHGSIHYLQCSKGCVETIWANEQFEINVDEETIQASDPLPSCPSCGYVARPNILMFGDYEWLTHRHDNQQRRYTKWLSQLDPGRLVAIEFGAGTTIPTVRYECQRRTRVLIRVNPRDDDVPPGAISLSLGALEAIRRIDQMM